MATKMTFRCMVQPLTRYTATKQYSIRFCRNCTVSKTNLYQFSKEVPTWHQCPSPKEVLYLKKSFPSAMEKVLSIINPLIDMDPSYKPKVENKRILNGRIWKSCITMFWPQEFKVCGKACDLEEAEHYAYLQICTMFQCMGLLTAKGDVLDYKEKLLEIQDLTFNRIRVSQDVTFHSKRKIVDNEPVWTTHLTLNWPIHIQLTSEAKSQKAAENMASALAMIKLKRAYMIDKHHRLCPLLAVLPYHKITDKQFLPDFTVVTDASKKGYGAYLLTKCEDKVRWIQEPWSPEVHQQFVLDTPQNTFLEFYAGLGAVYTWKKKFAGKKVLLLSDSLVVVKLVNEGILVTSQYNIYNKLFQILRNTCLRYCIHLQAKHVPRLEETVKAADYLSKWHTEEFRTIIPNASEKSKKPKKLEFFLPFMDTAVDNETKPS